MKSELPCAIRRDRLDGPRRIGQPDAVEKWRDAVGVDREILASGHDGLGLELIDRGRRARREGPDGATPVDLRVRGVPSTKGVL